MAQSLAPLLFLPYLSSILLLLLPHVYASSPHDNFLKCFLTHHTNPSEKSSVSHNIVFQKSNLSSYSSVLQNYIRNARFNTSSTPKPSFIITPFQDSHVQFTVKCAKLAGIQIRTRSGGHDFEGLSYASSGEPFILLDLFNLRNISVDTENDLAVVGAGATLGELYYNICNASNVHAFPAGVCPTVGVGGHFAGGGYGNLLRRYGLSVDNIVDARIVDVNGRILNRDSMGEDLFWAIRGGGGCSFGVILSYTVKLVRVPQTVTVFRVQKTLEQNATDLVLQWQQVAPYTNDSLFMRLLLSPVSSRTPGHYKTVSAGVMGLFLGPSGNVVSLLETEFPALGLKKQNCVETTWLGSVVWWAKVEKPEDLLDRNLNSAEFLKRKSDYVETPILRNGLESIWEKMIELGSIGLVFNPYGGKMWEIASNTTPFPHRGGNLYKIEYSVRWGEAGSEAETKFITEMRNLYSFMTPFVSRNPRRAFLNYRDLDIGINSFGEDSYEEGEVYGMKYFNGIFERLVKVKTQVDPENFFRNEQSIPVLPRKEGMKLKFRRMK